MVKFVFSFAKAALVSSLIVYFVTLRPVFPFCLAQFVQVFLLKPESFCKLSAGLDSINKTSIFFSLSSTLALYSSHCLLLHLSYLPKSLWQIWQQLLSPFVLSDCNGSPDTRFSRATMQQMCWPGVVPCFLQSLVVSLLLIFVSTLLFSRTGGALSYFKSSTHGFPWCQLRNLHFIVTLAVSSLVLVATDTAFCYTLISLELAESRILHAAPVTTRPKTLLIPFCTVQLRTLCAAHFLATLCILTSSPGPGKLLDLWPSMVFRQSPIPRKESGSINNNKEFVLQLVRSLNNNNTP